MFLGWHAQTMKGVTYRLSFRGNPGWAIGSTTQSLDERKRGYCKEHNARTHLYELIREVGRDGFDLTEIDTHYFTDVRELRRKEEDLIREHRDDLLTPHCLNTYAAHRTDEEWKQWYSEWRRAHPDKCVEYSRKWRENNQEQVKQRQRNYDMNKRKRTKTREEINKMAREAYHRRKAAATTEQPNGQSQGECL